MPLTRKERRVLRGSSTEPGDHPPDGSATRFHVSQIRSEPITIGVSEDAGLLLRDSHTALYTQLPTAKQLEAEYFLFCQEPPEGTAHAPRLVDGALECSCSLCSAWNAFIDRAWMDNSPQYQVLTRELVDGVANWLHHLATSGAACPLRVLEVGAGDGRLTACLRIALRILNASDSVWLVATDSFERGLRSVSQVEQLECRMALAQHRPHVVICSWMPLGEDWTAAFRSCQTVTKYLLLGEMDDGCCGRPWETWGYLSHRERASNADNCSVSSTTSETSSDDPAEVEAPLTLSEDAQDREAWRRVYEYAEERTPFGRQGWSRSELRTLTMSAVCKTDAPWCSTRHSHVVLFECMRDHAQNEPAKC